MIVFHDAAGRLVGTMHEGYPAPPEVIARVTPEGLFALDVPPIDGSFWRVEGSELRVRPVLEVARSVSVDLYGHTVLALGGLPAGLTIHVSGVAGGGEIESDGETVELVFPHPGRYRVSISGGLYQPVAFDQEVTDGAA